MNGRIGNGALIARTAALAILVISGTAAGETLYIPCPEWAAGDSWEMRSFIEHSHASPSAADQTITITSIVKSRDGNTIIVGEKRVTQLKWVDKRINRPDPPPQITSSEIVYEIAGDSFLLSRQTGDLGNVVFEPPIPTCGEVPETVSYRVKATMMGFSVSSETIARYQNLGTQLVSVPAGTFQTTVYEATQESISNQSNSAAPAATPPVMKLYVADGIGVVKTEMTSRASPRPMVVEPNPEAEALLQRGLEMVSKGEDFTEALNQAATSVVAESASASEDVQTTHVFELTVYRSAD